MSILALAFVFAAIIAAFVYDQHLLKLRKEKAKQERKRFEEETRQERYKKIDEIKAMPIRPFVIGLIKCIKFYCSDGDGTKFTSEAMGQATGAWKVFDQRCYPVYYPHIIRNTVAVIGGAAVSLNIRERSKIRHAIFYFKQLRDTEQRVKIKEQQEKAIKILESIVNQ